MARFSDILAAFAESGVPDDYADQLTGAYDEDIAEAAANAIVTASAQIDELTANNNSIQEELAKVTGELTAAQAANWRLSELLPDTSGNAVTPEEDGESENPADEGLDAFFGDEEEEDK